MPDNNGTVSPGQSPSTEDVGIAELIALLSVLLTEHSSLAKQFDRRMKHLERVPLELDVVNDSGLHLELEFTEDGVTRTKDLQDTMTHRFAATVPHSYKLVIKSGE